MPLSSLQLEAFMALARSKNFSEAARKIHITQSALSQRILNLEEELELTLFVREPGGARLTESGEKLLQHGQVREALEEDFLSKLKSPKKDQLAGLIRIAAFSTIARSILLPKFARFQRANPGVRIDLMVRETRELPGLLRSGQADFVFCTEAIKKQELENHLIGHEQNVLIESAKHSSKKDVYIDHDEFDTTTSDFWKIQRSPPREYSRAYFDEIYSIIDAVEEGLGRAVVPIHLIAKNSRVAIVEHLKPLRVPIYLIHFKQAFYTQLQKSVLPILSERIEPAS
jgi:DNA-binding transcriptional LysR family regulator